MPTIQEAVRAWELKDFPQARTLCRELIETELHARYLLASMLTYGQGGAKDEIEAARQFHLAADAGYPPAQFALGSLLARGIGIPQDFASALNWYLRAAEQGDPDAMYRAGVMFSTGEGTSPDPGLAAYWFFKAWQAGVDDAEQEIIRGRINLETAATSGSATAQNALGLILCFGHDEPGEAAEWFHRAAEQKHPEATRMLGLLHHEGMGVERDLHRAAHLYEIAANLGDSFAQFNLAVMIDKAEGGLLCDINLAIHWYRQAAASGLADAKNRLVELEAEAVSGAVNSRE